ncbi:protein-serine/threonine phosphatase [Trabulsiella odontotermitis]|uniref:protein-serine/threonine phosphatase n=1 Tax=Trabulsiella odontotermitis TaxID=379893 RepID=UPI003ABEB1CD
MYQRIEGKHWRHIWLVGDLHGCWQPLMAELKVRKFNPYQDLLISVGDLIDRGAASYQCLGLLNETWFAAIRGNHEQMAMDAVDNGDMSLWYMNGGDWFLDSTPAAQADIKRLLQKCHQLPYIIEVDCESGVNIVAHADYPAAEYAWQKAVDPQQVLWNRQRLSDHFAGRHMPITGADHFWFGHTPLQERYDVGNQHYIDTGAVFGGELTLVQLQ